MGIRELAVPVQGLLDAPASVATTTLDSSSLQEMSFMSTSIGLEERLQLARPDIQALAGSGAIVYKLGGSVTGADAENVSNLTELAPQQLAIWRQLASELVFLLEANDGKDPIVVVHGGGKAIDAELRRQGVTPVKIDGRRVTDADTMAVVEEVLSRQINSALVEIINQVAGYEAAVGLPGSQLLSAYKTERNGGKYGLVGEVQSVDVKRILGFQGKIVVVSPTAKNADTEGVSAGKYGSSLLNINGDDAAESVVKAIHQGTPTGVQCFIAATDVAGVKDGSKSVLSQLTKENADQLVQEGVIKDGMIPKVEAAQKLVALGIPHVRFVEGTAPGAIALGVIDQSGIGTRILR